MGKRLIIGTIIAAVILGVLYLLHRRDLAEAKALSDARVKEASLKITALSAALDDGDQALAELDSELAVKQAEIEAATEKLNASAEIISGLRKKDTKLATEKTPAECEKCFERYEKPVVVRLDGTTVYCDDNCLDDRAGDLTLDKIAPRLCAPYMDAAKDVAVKALTPPEKKFIQFNNRQEPFVRAATDGISLGYRQGLMRLGRVEIEPSADIRFDHRSGQVWWSAGVTVPINIGRSR